MRDIIVRDIIRCGIFLFGAFSLLTLNTLALSDPSNDSTKLENNSIEPIGIDICIDIIPYTHEELRDNSDTIVTGTVKEMLPPRWNTVDGKQPNKALNELRYPEDVIYTDIVISVDEYLKNPLSPRELIVRVTGGTIENVLMTTDADPSFSTGEKVLLYLRKDTYQNTKDIGPEHFIVTNFYRGKYTLTEDGKAINPAETVTLDKLLSTINQTVNDTDDTGMLDDTETSGKKVEEENTNSTSESKTAPFLNSFWMFTAMIGTVLILRHRQK